MGRAVKDYKEAYTEHANHHERAKEICSQLTESIATYPNIKWDVIEHGFTCLVDISSTTEDRVKKVNALFEVVEKVRHPLHLTAERKR